MIVENKNNSSQNKANDKKPEKKKHYWWKYLLCGLGGFVLAFASIAATGYVAATSVKTADLIRMAGGNPNELLTDEYQEDSLFQLITKLASGQVDFNSLESIASITPVIDSVLENINDTIETNLDFRFDIEALKNTAYEDIPQFIMDQIFDGVTLAKMIGGVTSESPKVMQYFLLHKYPNGTYGDPYTLSEYMSNGFMDNLINNAKLSDLFDTSESRILEVIGDLTITDLQNQEKLINQLKTLKLNDILSESDISSSTLLTALANKTIGDLASQDTINNLTLADILSAEQIAGSQLLTALQNKTINELASQDTINNLTLADILTPEQIAGSNLLTALQSKTISQLADNDTINSLKISDLLSSEQIAGSTLLTALQNKTINDLTSQDTINNLKISDILSAEQIAGSQLLTTLQNKTISELADDDTINNLTILELFGQDAVDGSQLLTALKNYTFADLKNDSTIKSLKLSDIFSPTEIASSTVLTALADKTISQLSEQSTLDSLTILQLFGQDACDGSQLLTALADKTINDLKNDSTIKSLKLSDIFSPTEIASSTILSALQNKSISDLSDQNAFDDLTILDLFGADAVNNSRLLSALSTNTFASLKDDATFKALGLDAVFTDSEIAGSRILTALNNNGATLGTLTTDIDNLELQDVIDIGTSPSTILENLKDVKISELSNKINNLTLQDVLDEPTTSDPQILKTLYSENVAISNLSTRLGALTLGDVFSSSDLEANFVLKHIDPTTSIDQLGTAVNTIKVVQIFEDDIYVHDADGNLVSPLTYRKAIWKYLLHESTENLDDPIDAAQDYTLAESMGKMIDNMEANIKRVNIRQLVNDGIFSISDATVLDKRLAVTYGAFVIYLDTANPTKTLGDYTIDGIIELLSQYTAE